LKVCFKEKPFTTTMLESIIHGYEMKTEYGYHVHNIDETWTLFTRNNTFKQVVHVCLSSCIILTKTMI